MKTIKIFFTALIFGIIYPPFLLKAREVGIQNDKLEVLDSSYLEQEFMADAVMRDSGSGNILIIIGAVLIIAAVAAYFIIRRRKPAIQE